MGNKSIQELFAMIDSFGDQVTKAGGVSLEGIEKVEEILEVRFPEAYREFLNRYGAITIGGTSILGVSFPVDCEPSMVWALKGLWKVFPQIPKNLIPIHDLSESGSVACIQCQSVRSPNEDAPVVSWRFSPMLIEENPVLLSQDFASYLHRILLNLQQRKKALALMEEHVQNFERDYLSQDKLPRNHIWRPYRFCSQDVVLGLTVVRHSIDNNCLEVDVFLTSDVPEFEEGIGTKITTSFLLSEAYKCGGSMEIRFSKNVEGGRVPQSLCELADRYRVNLVQIDRGRITPSEARHLYVNITEFSSSLEQRIENLARIGSLSQERACFAVQHGLWTHAELETIVLGSVRADRILGGEAMPEQRHLYLNDLLHARTAIMGGLLDRKLAKRERGDDNEALDLEDDVRPLEVAFDATHYAKLYTCSEEMPLPWLLGQEKDARLSAENRLAVLLRARDVDDLRLHLEEDLTVAGRIVASQENGATSKVCILVPRDFEDLPEVARTRFISIAESKSVGLMICPTTTLSLDSDATRRLISSRIMRE